MVYRFLLRVFLFIVLMLVLGELFFRTVIPAGNTAFRVHDREFGILLYDTAATRSGLFTSGRWAQQRSLWHVNNAGWKSDREYQPPSAARKPVIALIGDSYIAGFHVAEKEHISSVLRDRLNGCYDVYSFGIGGSPLSEFVWIARYAAERFDPDVFVFLVGDGDWKSSLTNVRPDSRVHQVTWKDGRFEDAPFSYDDSPKGRLPKYSAIIRYLAFNADVQVTDFLRREKPASPADTSESRLSKEELDRISDQAAAYFANRLEAEHPGKQIVFMVDARRSRIYSGDPDYTQRSVARLEKVCNHSNVHVLNLAPLLKSRYARDHQRFDFTFDDHWNAHGHEVLGEALADYLTREHIVNRADSSVAQQ